MRKQVAQCLDEIDVCCDKIEKGKISKNIESKLRGWIRKQKIILQDNNYQGKVRRIKRGK